MNKKITKNYISNMLLNTILKKGKNFISKKLIFNSSIGVSKKYNFYKLLENIIKNSISPVKITKKRNKYKYKHCENIKSISDFIIKTINCVQNKKKKISFDFYFKNEIGKFENILNNSINIEEKNLINIFDNLNLIFIKKNKKLNKNTKTINIVGKKNKINFVYKQINLMYNYNLDIIYRIDKFINKKIQEKKEISINEENNLNFI